MNQIGLGIYERTIQQWRSEAGLKSYIVIEKLGLSAENVSN